jgi:Flp pilus assembly protein TadG
MRSESGQATLEFSAMLIWLLIAGLFAWQLGLVAWSFVSASNAARTAARIYSRVGDTNQAIAETKKSFTGVLGTGSNVQFVQKQTGEEPTAEVTVTIPLLLPSVGSPFTAHGEATMPHTG